MQPLEDNSYLHQAVFFPFKSVVHILSRLGTPVNRGYNFASSYTVIDRNIHIACFYKHYHSRRNVLLTILNDVKQSTKKPKESNKHI